MRTSPALRTVLWLAVAALPLCSQAPAVNEAHGMPPRTAPGEYQAQGKAGDFTIAAEFMGHAVPTQDGVFNSDDYVVVETAFFGPADARLKLSIEDFTLRINAKKTAAPSVNSMQVLRSLKDPSWVPPAPPEKSKTSFGSGGNQGEPPPLPPKMPMELQHAMTQKVQKAAMLEGDRPLPQAGLLFFPYHGKAESIHSVELIYSGPAGQATINLQP